MNITKIDFSSLLKIPSAARFNNIYHYSQPILYI